MRRPALERILVLTGVCLVPIFLGFKWRAYKSLPAKNLPHDTEFTAEPVRGAEGDPFQGLAEAAPARPANPDGRFERTDLEFGRALFHVPAELEEFAARGSVAERTIAPPLGLRWSQHEGGILLEWQPNPENEDIAADIAGDPLRSMGYLIYRWRANEEPVVVATAPLEQTSFVDRRPGPRGGSLQYAVVTVLQHDVGGRESIERSERSQVVEVDLADTVATRLVGGTAEAAVVEVTVGGGRDRRTRRFEVAAGERVGAPVEVDGVETDFTTPYTVDAIEVAEELRERRVRRPVFQPDGSRAMDDSGFAWREEVRQVPVRVLRVTVRNDRDEPSVWTADLP